ncbi:unnamed protein product [Mytilus coruscus]|uniref:Uncharacterized protein n=1 Tax=Mytilus coruscus TaxID=42192 RepID=A0A6J8BDN8_MYTCO|nr:unnamed protein product [Mytilus coruscus]
MSVINVDADVKLLNDKTCEVREDPTTYDQIEFDCKFQGAGLYVFEGRSSSTVEKLSMDRLTPLSFLNIPQGTGLQMVDLAERSCDQIKAPVNVDIWVAGKPCVEATSTHQRLQSTHLPVNPSQTDNSRTDPNLYTSVPVETTTMMRSPNLCLWRQLLMMRSPNHSADQVKKLP